MNVDSIRISATTQAASTADRPASSLLSALTSAPSSFNATLVSSISNYKPQESDSKAGVGNSATVVAKSDDESVKLALKPKAKLAGKAAEKLGAQADQTADAKPVIEHAPNAVTTPTVFDSLTAALPISRPISAAVASVLIPTTSTPSNPVEALASMPPQIQTDASRTAVGALGDSSVPQAAISRPSTVADYELNVSPETAYPSAAVPTPTDGTIFRDGQSSNSTSMPTIKFPFAQSLSVQSVPVPMAAIAIPETLDASINSLVPDSSSVVPTSIVVLQSPSSDNLPTFISLTSTAQASTDVAIIKSSIDDPALAPLTSAKSSETKVDTASPGNSIAVSPTPSNSTAASTAAMPAFTESVNFNVASVPIHSSDTGAVAAQSAQPSETPVPVVSNISDSPNRLPNNDASLTPANSNFNSNSNSNTLALVATPIPNANSATMNAANMAAPTATTGIPNTATVNAAPANAITTSDEASTEKAGSSVAVLSAAAIAASAADKKPLIAVQATAGSPPDLSSHGAFAIVAPANDLSAALTASSPPVSAPATAASDPAVALPQTHQMLDSAPPATPAPATAPIAPGSAAELQMNAQVNAQMHLDIRTDAFGAVEIHTVVQQSQVGITVHANGDIARWFSSEVPGLESGLSKSHLNLTAVDFDNGRSGVQTSSGFQQGQPRQNFSQDQGTAYSVRPGEDTATKSTAVDKLPPELTNGRLVTRVSIHA
jgi:hypothetical protein